MGGEALCKNKRCHEKNFLAKRACHGWAVWSGALWGERSVEARAQRRTVHEEATWEPYPGKAHEFECP